MFGPEYAKSYGMVADERAQNALARQAKEQDIQRNALLMQLDQQKIQDANALRGMTPEQVTPEVLMKLGQFDAAIKMHNENRKRAIDAFDDLARMSQSILKANNQEAYDLGLQYLGQKYGPEIVSKFPPRYDAQYLRNQLATVLKAKQVLPEWKIVSGYRGGKSVTGVIDLSAEDPKSTFTPLMIGAYQGPGGGGSGGGGSGGGKTGPTQSQAHKDRLSDAEVKHARQTIARMPQAERVRAFSADPAFMALVKKAHQPLRNEKDFKSWYVTKQGKILIDGKEWTGVQNPAPGSTVARKSFDSEDDAMAALSAGIIKSGDKIIIGGRPARVP